MVQGYQLLGNILLIQASRDHETAVIVSRILHLYLHETLGRIAANSDHLRPDERAGTSSPVARTVAKYARPPVILSAAKNLHPCGQTLCCARG